MSELIKEKDMTKDPRTVFQTAFDAIEDSLDMIRETYNGSRHLSHHEMLKLDKLYEISLNFKSYYETLNDRKINP